MFCKKSILKTFAPGKHLCQNPAQEDKQTPIDLKCLAWAVYF